MSLLRISEVVHLLARDAALAVSRRERQLWPSVDSRLTLSCVKPTLSVAAVFARVTAIVCPGPTASSLVVSDSPCPVEL